jgi:hypothetical protein
MDHAFPSKRETLDTVGRGVALLDSIATLNRMTAADAAHVARRCDDLVSDASIREEVREHASHLGLMIRMAEEVCVAHSLMPAAKLRDTMEEAWIARLQTGTPMPAEHVETLDALRGMLAAIRDDLSEYEGTDDGGSSPSDYSDSEQSDDDDDDDGPDDTDESEDD